jgi:hypothetical protein
VRRKASRGLILPIAATLILSACGQSSECRVHQPMRKYVGPPVIAESCVPTLNSIAAEIAARKGFINKGKIDTLVGKQCSMEQIKSALLKYDNIYLKSCEEFENSKNFRFRFPAIELTGMDWLSPTEEVLFIELDSSDLIKMTYDGLVT